MSRGRHCGKKHQYKKAVKSQHMYRLLWALSMQLHIKWENICMMNRYTFMRRGWSHIHIKSHWGFSRAQYIIGLMYLHFEYFEYSIFSNTWISDFSDILISSWQACKHVVGHVLLNLDNTNNQGGDDDDDDDDDGDDGDDDDGDNATMM